MSMAERIGIPSLSIGSIGVLKAGSIINSPGWQFAVQGLGMLAAFTASVWAIIKIVDYFKNKKRSN
jgi:hypothetical protein